MSILTHEGEISGFHVQNSGLRRIVIDEDKLAAAFAFHGLHHPLERFANEDDLGLISTIRFQMCVAERVSMPENLRVAIYGDNMATITLDIEQRAALGIFINEWTRKWFRVHQVRDHLSVGSRCRKRYGTTQQKQG